jgi:3-dehydroquinate dehydratase type I
MSRDPLDGLRAKIREKDKQIVRLLCERAEISVRIGRVKASRGIEVRDPARESGVFGYIEKMNSGPLPGGALERIYREIISASRSLQDPVSAFPGPAESSGESVWRGARTSTAGVSPWGGFSPVICVSVHAESEKELIARCETAAGFAAVVELRVDYARRVNIENIVRSARGRIIVTNRRRSEGGRFEGSEAGRIDILARAAACGAHFVDIELGAGPAAARDVLAAAGGGTSRLIISHHDFTGTPDEKTLCKKADACIGRGADIVKIATFARSGADNLRTLGLIPSVRDTGRGIISFCMGDRGRISRIASPLLGAFLTYASLADGKETAPGQIPIGDMKAIFTALGISGPEQEPETAAGAGEAT